MSVGHSTGSGGIVRISFRFSLKKVCYVYSLESPYQGDSNKYTQQTIYHHHLKRVLRTSLKQPWETRAISIRATKVVLYYRIFWLNQFSLHMVFFDSKTPFVKKANEFSNVKLTIIMVYYKMNFNFSTRKICSGYGIHM